MLEAIKDCSACRLCDNQRPLVDETCNPKVFWVGLSAKKIKSADERPLSSITNSGRVIACVEEQVAEVSMYKTNLVKCLPLDERGKLRYPNKDEIRKCISNLDLEIALLSPSIVVLLGNKVIEAVGQYYEIPFDVWTDFDFKPKLHNNMYFVPVQHPSYVYVYKRRMLDDYIAALEAVIRRLTKKEESG